ncbi:hypothetical protein HII31_10350 [Pseudocercospora fuligena]|uniref:Uncharacterized protein n=1 Tax=Pseudocercospora fuligena TaxID=685502 RepID=A0A8H6RDY8_9PEZI|nr:hypothetical protein HII31_10350 [Pseudocercospora fuligena]
MTQENPPLPAVLNASMWPALLQGFLELTRYGLGPRGWYNTSPELYDRFVSLISETAKLDQYEREMYLARLDLCHPQRKNDVAAIAILEKFMANKENALKCQLDDKPSSGPYSKRVASVLGFMQHTAGVADYLEHHDKASWIRNEVMKKFEQEHGQDDSHAASNSKQDKPSIYSR